MRSKVNILVVDDHPNSLLALEAILKPLEQNLIKASLGKEALEHVMKHDFAVILLDVHLPDISGLEVATLIRGRKKSRNIPIIFITGASTDDKMLEAYSLGAVDYILKPIIPEILKSKVAAFVDLFQKTKQLQLLNQDLKESKRLADTANKAKTDFLAKMSHEIRTPMNAISGLAQLLEDTELTLKQANYIQKMQQASKNLLGIINDILDISKIEAGKMEIESIEFDLNEVMRHLAMLTMDKAREKGLEFIFKIDPKVPNLLEGDPLRLGQILLNLANNAIKFTESGEIVVLVTVTESEDLFTTLKFSVEDTGIGISLQDMPHLFSSFAQADESVTRKYGGTGLGLSICKALVEMMGGEIGAESELGKGSHFFFTTKLKCHSKSTKISLSKEIQGMKILIVDDNPHFREYMQVLLRDLSFIVTTVSSGEKAIVEVQNVQTTNEPYKLVLVDFKMDGIDGIETVHKLQELKISPMPKFIMISGSSKTVGYSEQVDGLLVKPVLLPALTDLIAKVFTKETQQLDNKSKLKTHLSIAGAKILLVEDNLINQEVAIALLESQGAQITVASDGNKAIEKLELSKNFFDIILMDIHMPHMDGYQATQLIRNKLEFHNIPIIAMTADAVTGTQKKILEVGMNDYVAKPFKVDNLLTVLHKWLKSNSDTRC